MGDFNINLLGVEKCNYGHNFLLSSQSFSSIPTIDKPSRVHKNSATLIDNILLNRFHYISPAGILFATLAIIIHNSVFSTLLKKKCLTGKQKKRYFSNFSEINIPHSTPFLILQIPYKVT